ncbi:NTP transferase domain-containing protein [Helicobacter sp. T3_23-1059]
MSPSKNSTTNYAVILAGGVSKRMGDMSLPKHFLEICGIPIIVLTIQNIINSSLSYFCL